MQRNAGIMLRIEMSYVPETERISLAQEICSTFKELFSAPLPNCILEALTSPSLVPFSTFLRQKRQGTYPCKLHAQCM